MYLTERAETVAEPVRIVVARIQLKQNAARLKSA